MKLPCVAEICGSFYLLLSHMDGLYDGGSFINCRRALGHDALRFHCRNEAIVLSHRTVSYTHLDVYKRQLYNSGLYAKHYLILFEFAAVIVCQKKNFP